MAAKAKAIKVENERLDYVYERKGVRVFGSFRKGKTINCARYANKILKAAGISNSLKDTRYYTPYKTATGKSYVGKRIGQWFTKKNKNT